MIETSDCCQCDKNEVVIQVRRDLSYVRCAKCGHLEQVCHDADDSFQQAQEQCYFDSIDGAFKEQISLDTDRLSVRQRAIARTEVGLNAIEIGPGRGTFLKWLLENGFAAKAVEHSPVVASELSRRLEIPVLDGEFESADIDDEVFDCAFSFHVIEHVPDAEAHLRTACRILKPGGYLFVATPNGNSWQHRLSANLAPNYSSAHLRLFSKRSLRVLCERSGFSIVEALTPEYASAWMRVGSKVIRRIRNEDAEKTAGKYAAASWKSNLLVRVFKVMSLPLRLVQQTMGGGNELFFVLQKPASNEHEQADAGLRIGASQTRVAA